MAHPANNKVGTEPIGLDIIQSHGKISHDAQLFYLLLVFKPFLLAFRRGMYAAIREVELLYQLKPDEERLDPELLRLIDERIRMYLREAE